MHLNRVYRFFKYLILGLALLFVLVLTGVNLPFSQRIITKKANEFFSGKNLPVHVGKISLLINGKIGLSRPRIIKNSGDTIVFAEKIKASVRIFPLLFKKVKVNSITLNDATVHITMDTASGKPDLVALFSPGNKPPKTKKTGKKWDIQVNTVNLKNIRFTYSDALHGIQINQTIGKLFIRFDKFSLISRQVYAALIDLEKVQGGIALQPVSRAKDPQKKPPVLWKFKLTQSDLKDIAFILHQPAQNQRIEISLGRGDISDVGVDLAGRRISMARLMLQDPGALLLSSPAPAKTKPVPGTDTGPPFPGNWNISGSNAKITNGSVQFRPYHDASQLPADQGSFRVATLNTTLKDLRLSSQESGFTMNRLSFLLGNGFQLDKGEISFRSDSTLKSLLTASLTTASSRINLEVEAGNDLAALIRSYRTVPFSLNMDNAEISARDILAFFPHLKEKLSRSAQKNFRLGINCNITGTADLLKIGNFTLNTPSGDALFVSGQVTNILKSQSALCSVAFRTGMITRSRLDELIHLTGSSVILPDFEPLTLQGEITNRLIAPEFSLSVQSLSGNVLMDGSMNLPEKSYALKMTCSGLELGKLSGIKDLDRLSGSLELTGAAFIPDRMKIKAAVTIDSAGYRGYNYQDIHIELDGDHGLYTFGVTASDTSFGCNLTGSVDRNDSLTKGLISGTFNLDAGSVNLVRGVSISGALEAEMNHRPGDISASVSLGNVILGKDNNTEDLKGFSLSFHSSDTVVEGRIRADFLRADFHSTGSIGDLKKVITEGRFRGFALLDSTMENKVPYITALPDMFVSVESTYDPFIGLLLNDSIFAYHRAEFKLVKDTTGIARAELSVDKFNFGTNSGFGTTVHLESLPDKSYLLVKTDSMRHGKISLTDMAVDMTITGDTTMYRLKASDKNDRLLYDLAGVAYKDERSIKLKSAQPQWTLNGFNWTVSPGEFLVLEPEKKDFTADLHWKNDQSAIDIYGRKTEKLFLECRKVWLNMLVIPGLNTFGYDGELTGKIDYQGSNKNALGIQMDIRQMKMAESSLGNMKINGSYSSDTLGTIQSDLHAVMNDTSRLDLIVRFGQQAGHKSIRTDFSDIPLNIFESLVSKYISGLHGDVSGGLELTSIGNKPQLNGSIQFNQTALKIVPLNASFHLSDDVIKLENNQLLFSQFMVLDSLNKRLNLNGAIDLNDPRNITADLRITSDQIQVMNTTEKDNPAFNGSVFVNLKLNITGPVQKPSLSGNIVLAKGTVINYRYTEDLTVSETEKTITFTSFKQDQSSANAKSAAVNPLSVSPNIKASIEIDPNSLFNFQISRGFDIGVQITGGGFLNYALMPNKAMNLTGTYEIQEGSAELKITGWPSKNFIITPGS